ncbi:DNA polymerase III subunit delta' [Bacillus taeanensis]|uniref:DNA polymerase III subunit delta' n=1 Tax=Bacillus taeanensis TaxID=273032 RepID=UPI00319E240E
MIFLENWNEWQQKQPKIVKMLTNSLVKDRLAHAYLFEGSTGVGKKAIAIQLTKSFFCMQRQGIEPCNSCSDCRRIDSHNHPDVHIISPDGQSIKIDQIRQLQKEFSYLGMESNRKVYILEHADRMTTQAANSLLKFLEEPSRQTLAVLLTEQIHRILPTIYSRCQVLSFRPLTSEELVQQLLDQNLPNNLVRLAASLTNNSRTAKEMIEDEWFAQARKIVIQLTEELLERPHQVLLTIQEKWLSHFQEKDQLTVGLNLLLLWYKDLLLIKLNQGEKIVYTDEQNKLERYALQTSQQRISRDMTAVLDAKRRLDANTNAQLVMEQVVLKLREG